jgi:hypothetical protein
MDSNNKIHSIRTDHQRVGMDLATGTSLVAISRREVVQALVTPQVTPSLDIKEPRNSVKTPPDLNFLNLPHRINPRLRV